MRATLGTTRIPALLATVLLGGIVACGSGCQDPDYASQRRIRDERINNVLEQYAARETQGPKRMQWLLDSERKMNAQRAQRLQATPQVVREYYRRDQRNWQENAPLRKAWCRKMWDGMPENIPEFIVHTVY
jgi:hypothetical protein